MRRDLATKTHVAKRGYSLAVRLPRPVAHAAQLMEGDTVNVSVENGAVLIRRARRRHSLADLLSRISASNRHDVSDWIGPVGREAW